MLRPAGGAYGLWQRETRGRPQARPQRHGLLGDASGGQGRGPQAAAACRSPSRTESHDASRRRPQYKVMQHLRLKDGAPDEPDTGDWDAICATPRIGDFFTILFKEV